MFHERLLELRKKAAMTQSDLAEKLNVSRQAVSRWEMGTAMPDVENLIAMSELFNVSLDYLLKGKGNEVTTSEEPLQPQALSEPRENKGSWLILLVLPPFLGLSFLVYGWLLEKRVMLLLGLGLIGLSVALLAVLLLVLAVVFLLRRLKKKG